MFGIGSWVQVFRDLGVKACETAEIQQGTHVWEFQENRETLI